MKYFATTVLFALIGLVGLPWLILSQIASPGVGPNGETLAACGMPALAALISAPLGAFGGALCGLLVASLLRDQPQKAIRG